jgi:hypothetical protein
MWFLAARPKEKREFLPSRLSEAWFGFGDGDILVNDPIDFMSHFCIDYTHVGITWDEWDDQPASPERDQLFRELCAVVVAESWIPRVMNTEHWLDEVEAGADLPQIQLWSAAYRYAHQICGLLRRGPIDEYPHLEFAELIDDFSV